MQREGRYRPDNAGEILYGRGSEGKHSPAARQVDG